MTSRLAYTNAQARTKSKVQSPKSFKDGPLTLDFGLWTRTRIRRAARRGYSLRWRALPPDYNRTYRLTSNGFEITVLPSVFHPKWHFISEFLGETCSLLIQ